MCEFMRSLSIISILSTWCFIWPSQNWNWLYIYYRNRWIEDVSSWTRFVWRFFLLFGAWRMPWKWNHFNRMLFVLDSILFHCSGHFSSFCSFSLHFSIEWYNWIDFCFFSPILKHTTVCHNSHSVLAYNLLMHTYIYIARICIALITKMVWENVHLFK